MTTTLTWDVLRTLAAFRAVQGCAISFYLDLDPSASPTAADAATRVNSLLDEAGKRVSETELSHAARQGLRADFERIRGFFGGGLDRDGARGLVIFADELDNLWRSLALVEAVPDALKINEELFLSPLVPLVGRGGEAVVAVVGRERGELLQLRGGRLEAVADQTEEQPGRHDQGGWSQARFQRHIDNLVHEHLKRVADELDRWVRRHPHDAVVVVASEETRSEFDDLLGKETRDVVVGWTQAEAHAGPPELLHVVDPLLAVARMRQESELVERWREEAGRNGRAATGWEATLEAASDGRVDLLLYRPGADRRAWRCPACGRLAAAGGACPLDGTAMESREEGIDLAIHHTLSNGGKVVAVTSRDDLDPVEGLAALLRF